MIARLAVALAIASAGTSALASPIAAVVGPDGAADVRTSTLVGPSGQVYIGDGAGRWVRRAPGGVAADVSGATRLGKDVIVTGISTPMYRFDGTGWTGLRLGQTGKTILGRGPTPAVAIGRQVFVLRAATWVRVGEIATGVITALWASSTKKVFLVTAAGVHALRGTDFVRTRAAVDAIVGATAWGISSDGAIDLGTGRQVVAAPGTVAATGGDGAPWLISSDGTAPLHLVTRVAGKPRTIDTPIAAGTAIAGMASDHGGRVLVVTTAGAVHLWVDDAWTTGSLADELPAARPGAGPAITR